MKKSGNWTKEEDNMLREYYKNGEWNLGKPNRSQYAIESRVQRLKLKFSIFNWRKVRRRSGKLSANDYGRLNGNIIARIKRRAIAKKIDHPILDGNKENMHYLNSIAHNVCAISGLPIRYKNYIRDNTATASLDRIDSNKGYIKGNVQWVHKKINQMKWLFSKNEFIELCVAVAKNNQ